jgi:hypothetical protein
VNVPAWCSWSMRPSPLARLAAAMIIGTLAAGLLLWWRQASVGPAATPSPSPSATPSGPVATPTPSPSPVPSPTGPYSELRIPSQLIRQIPLPSGANVRYGIVAADGNWLVANLTFLGESLGHQEQLYALNILTGETRRLADHGAAASVSADRLAWLDATCQYIPSVGGRTSNCSSWRLQLTDLTSGSDRVVASGRITEAVTTLVYQYGGGEQVAPILALGASTLAYTTGDLRHGFTLHLLDLASSSERTIKLAGMVDVMGWAGSDLAWIEDTDLRHDGLGIGYFNPDYYAGTRLMVLASDMTEPREVATPSATNPIWLATDTSGLYWGSNQPSPGYYVAAAPYTQLSYGGTVSETGTSYVDVSGGWTGWSATVVVGGKWEDAYLVRGPAESRPRAVANGIDMSGGWLFLAHRDPETLEPMDLEAVRIADLP